jgi:nucleotide-binding universal stress UspA family protein
MAADALFEQPRLGSTVAWLAQHARLPLLVVRNRALAPYRSMALACDFSPHCAHALEQAVALFGEPLQLDLVHALEMPRSGLLTSTLDSQQLDASRIAASQARQFLADCTLSDALRLRAQVVIAPGEPGRVVGQHVRSNDSELVVVGSHGRSALSRILLGSDAQRLLDSSQSDTLLVHRANDACPES